MAPLRHGGEASFPTETGPDGRKGDHKERRRGGAHQADASHLWGGFETDGGIGTPSKQAYLYLDHVARPR